MTLKQGQAALPVIVDIFSPDFNTVVNGVNGTQGAQTSGSLTLCATFAYTDKEGAMLQSDPSLTVVAADGSRRNGNMGTSDELDNDNNVEQVVWQATS